MLQGEQTLLDYLAAHDVRYVIDGNTTLDGKAVADFPVVRSWAVPYGTTREIVLVELPK